MTYDGSLKFDTKIDTNGFNQGTNTIQNSISGLKSSFLKLGATIAAAFGVRALVNFGKEAINIASDLQEVQNVVDTAFGDMAYKAEEFASIATESFGMSELSAKQAASTYMAMSKSMGLSQEEASDMAISIAALTGDVASFYNISQELASIKLKSIWTGETETLKDLGVVMTQVNLNAFAMANGINKTIDEMTQAEQVQLRYMYVTNQLAMVQGDFAKTSNSWANQVRVLSERWKEFKSVIGDLLINFLTPLVKTLNGLLENLINMIQSASNSIAALFGIELKSQTKSANATMQNAEAQAELASNIEKTKKAVDNSIASFDELNILSKTEDESSSPSFGNNNGNQTNTGFTPDISPWEAAANKIKGVFSGLKDWFQQNFGQVFDHMFDGLKENLENLKNTFKKVFNDIKKLIGPFLNYIEKYFVPFFKELVKQVDNILNGLFDSFNRVFNDIWNIAIYPIMQKLITTVLPVVTEIGTEILKTLGVLFDNVKRIFDKIWSEAIAPAMGIIVGIWSDGWDSVKRVWDERGATLFEGIRTAIDTLGDVFMSLWDNFLKPVFDWISGTVTWLWDEHLKPLWDNVVEFFASVMEFATVIWNNFLGPLVNNLVTVLGPIFSTVFGTIGAVVGTVIGGIADVIGGIIKTLTGLLDFLTGLFTGNWEKAWSGIQKIFGGIWDTLYGIFKVPINLIIDGLNFIWGAVYSVAAGIVNGIGNIAGAIGDLFGQDWHFDMPATPPLIPKLASGTVVPANYGEFIATLGDNKKEPEIVSPLSTMVDAFKEALASANFGSTDNGPIIIQIDSREIARAVRNGTDSLGYSKVSGGLANAY